MTAYTLNKCSSEASAGRQNACVCVWERVGWNIHAAEKTHVVT